MMIAVTSLTALSLIQITFSQQADIDDYECLFPILSNDHSQGQLGQYFNFDISTVNCILGQNQQLSFGSDGNIFDVFYSGDNSIRKVKMWVGPNGGTIGDGHGRSEPESTSINFNWAIGEWIGFNNINVECGCNVTTTINDFECSFPIQTIEEYTGNHEDGKYFTFDPSIAECTLGSEISFGQVFNIFYSGDNSFREVILWIREEENIGSGRKNAISGWDDLSINDWQVGERIAFLEFNGQQCQCPTQLFHVYINEITIT